MQKQVSDFFINELPFTQKPQSETLSFLDKIFRKFGFSVKRALDSQTDMNTVEQRINYYLLLESVIGNNIPGDVVEMGCFTGQCAMIFQKIIQQYDSDKELHLYDSFETKFTMKGDIQEVLKNNFLTAGLKLPALHKGYFQDTMPQQLPDKICFAHIDCGFGGDKEQHKNIVLFCLQHIYPRLSPGAICILMDYHDETIPGNKGWDANPGAKLACDEFLKDKREFVISLYGNEYSHGFFRKL